MPVIELKWTRLVLSVLLALAVVLVATSAYLSRGLSAEAGETLQLPVDTFKFAIGSGKLIDGRVRVDKFSNGNALLSSGPVQIQADSFRILEFNWQPTGAIRDAAFFWRRTDDPGSFFRTDIGLAGIRLLDLFNEADWSGEVIEFGFLFVGDTGTAVEIGTVSLQPDTMNQRLQLMWRGWVVFEEWTQRSINLLYGGESNQLVPLPVIVIAWFLIATALFWLFSIFGKSIDFRQSVVTGGLLFLVAWILLDIRWLSNNIEQIQRSFLTHSQTDEQQRLSMELDGEVYNFIQKLKSGALRDKTGRILIVGDEFSIDYYKQRAKYHLLPNSVYVASKFPENVAPNSLDYVLFFGQSAQISNTPGWSLDWRQALVEVERGELGVVYRIIKL